MPSCEKCGKTALYVVKVKKSEEDDKAYRVCQEHRDEIEKECKANDWEFMEVK